MCKKTVHANTKYQHKPISPFLTIFSNLALSNSQSNYKDSLLAVTEKSLPDLLKTITLHFYQLIFGLTVARKGIPKMLGILALITCILKTVLKGPNAVNN